MKKTIILVVILLPLFSFGQETINFRHTVKNSIFCVYAQDFVTKCMEGEVIFCKVDTLEDNMYVKNCVITSNDSWEVFICSNVYDTDRKIKVSYIELNNGTSLYLDETSRSKYHRFFYDMDRFLKKLYLKKLS